MNRFSHEIRITPSVLDRLLDDAPGISHEPPASRAHDLARLKAAVKRDLEWLFNTRQTPGGVPDGLPEASRSLAAYGLPDFTGISIKNPAEQLALRRAIESAISFFEPRLEDVIVYIKPMKDAEMVLSLRVDARLKVEPAPEPVTFDTVLQLGSGQFEVKGV